MFDRLPDDPAIDSCPLPSALCPLRTVVARAPVRISFGGGGTDLPAYYERFGGFVVGAAIARYAYAVAGPSLDGGVGINSADYRLWERTPPGEVPAVAEPLSLPKAAVEWFAERGLLGGRGVELFTASEVPPGSGLGSSSAMAVALVRALAGHVGLALEKGEVADLASRLEIDRLQRPIGRQDQYASTFGGLNAIEFRADGVEVSPLPVAADVAAALNERLLLFSTGQTRDSAGILGRQRAATTTNSATVERLHRMKELAWRMRDALVAADLDGFGRLLDEGWRLKRGLGNGISSAAIDRWYAAARGAGALGGKIAGAGGGGFLMLYCPTDHARLTQFMLSQGMRRLPYNLEFEGAKVITNVFNASSLAIHWPTMLHAPDQARQGQAQPV